MLWELIEKIEEIAGRAFDDGYDGDRAILDLMEIDNLIIDMQSTVIDLSQFDRMVMESLENIGRLKKQS